MNESNESASRIDETLSGPAASGFSPPSLEEMASRFPNLEILELLGKGGMGAVYKARQKGLDRLVAVKILPPEFDRDPSFAERFVREARALARLNHQNIVSVFDFGQAVRSPVTPASDDATGLYFIVMEYIDGINLRQAIRAGDFSTADVLAVVPQICEALQFAHDEGIVHRDIKPENILVDRKGRVKIADFGLAKLLGIASSDKMLTGSQQVMGTLRYMAPEQMEGAKSVDHRADIYSLGVVFYEMLTGELPMGRFAPPSEKVQMDVRLDEVVLRSLARDPERRYQRAKDVKTDVECISLGPNSSVANDTIGQAGERVTEFGFQISPRDSTDILFGSAMVVFGFFAYWLCPSFLVFAVTSLFTFSIPKALVSGILIGTGVCFTIFIAFLLGSVRGTSVNQNGLTIHRYLGSGSFLGWQKIDRVQALTRWEAFQQVWLWPGLPPRGSVVGASTCDYFRIDVQEKCWYFCPAEPCKWTGAIEAAGLRVLPADPTASRQAISAGLPIFVAAFLILLTFGSLFGYVWLLPMYKEANRKPEVPRSEQSSAIERPKPWELEPNLILGSDSARVSEWFTRNVLDLNDTQADAVTKAVSDVYSEYLSLEKQNSDSATSETGKLITIIRPIPGEISQLENRLWSKLDSILNNDQQRIARLNLKLGPPELAAGMTIQEMVAPGLFGWGDAGATIEIWSVGTWKHWTIRARGEEFTSSASELPPYLARFQTGNIAEGQPPDL